MAESMRLVSRPQEIEAILWDGSDESVDWILDRFSDYAEVTGETPEERELRFYGTWVIDQGWYLLDQGGSFSPIPADQLSGYQLAEPPVVAE